MTLPLYRFSGIEVEWSQAKLEDLIARNVERPTSSAGVRPWSDDDKPILDAVATVLERHLSHLGVEVHPRRRLVPNEIVVKDDPAALRSGTRAHPHNAVLAVTVGLGTTVAVSRSLGGTELAHIVQHEGVHLSSMEQIEIGGSSAHLDLNISGSGLERRSAGTSLLVAANECVTEATNLGLRATFWADQPALARLPDLRDRSTAGTFELGLPFFDGLIDRASNLHGVEPYLVRQALQRDQVTGGTTGLRLLLSDLATGSLLDRDVYAAICRLTPNDVIAIGDVAQKVAFLHELCGLLDMPETAAAISRAADHGLDHDAVRSAWSEPLLRSAPALDVDADLPGLPPPPGSPATMRMELRLDTDLDHPRDRSATPTPTASATTDDRASARRSRRAATPGRSSGLTNPHDGPPIDRPSALRDGGSPDRDSSSTSRRPSPGGARRATPARGGRSSLSP